MIETVRIFRAGFAGNRANGCWVSEGGAVDEEDVEAAIVVVVEQSYARAHGLDEIFLGCVGGLCVEENVTTLSDVDEVAGCWRRGGYDRCRRGGLRILCVEWGDEDGRDRQEICDMNAITQTYESFVSGGADRVEMLTRISVGPSETLLSYMKW